MPNVSFKHEDFRRFEQHYELISDCLEGEFQIKFRREKYLPRPNPHDTSEENMARYNAYVRRAVFYNVSGRTLAAFVGQVFTRDPILEIPDQLTGLIEDADGSGVSLEQIAMKAVSYTVAYGRCGILADYPDNAAAGAVTKEQQESGELQPTMNIYGPKQIINWSTITKGKKKYLSLVVLEEEYIESSDGFERKKKKQWRVLRLDGANEYVVEIWRNAVAPVQRFKPRDSEGNPFNQIPFSFIGSNDNDEIPDPPPMFDMCSLNIAHYRNSADYEEGVYVHGQPTVWVSGLSEHWYKNVLGGKILMGARTALALPADADAGILQAEPNMPAKEAMDQKEAQMLALGAKLIEGSQVERTATEAEYDNLAENSVLARSSKNVSKAFTFALEMCAKFAGAPTEITTINDNDQTTERKKIAYVLSTEFDLMKLSAEERQQLLAEYQANVLSFEEVRDNLRRAGIATLTDKVAKEKIDAEQDQKLEREIKLKEAAPPKPPMAA